MINFKGLDLSAKIGLARLIECVYVCLCVGGCYYLMITVSTG